MAQSSAIFITATEARQNPLRERVVHDEARGIESAILDAVRVGLYETTVSNGTPMTNSVPVMSEAWTVDAVTDQIYVPSHGFSTGDSVMLSSTRALPSPFKSNQYYYVVFVDNDHIKLAASYSDAVSGRPVSIDITSGVVEIRVGNQGSGYLQPPVISLNGGGASTAATARAYLAPWGSIIGINNSNSGSGYNDRPSVQIVAQGSGASHLSITYCIVGISVSSLGINYHVGDIISVLGGSGPAATATVTAVSSTGQIQSLQLSNAGAYVALPSLVSASTTVLPGGGTGATVNLTAGISGIALSSGGNSYASPPRIRIVDPSGVGAVASANLIGGSVGSIGIINPGYGYVGVTDVIFDSGSGASAVASMVPTGVGTIVVTNPGSSYTSPPSVTISPVGSGCVAGTIEMQLISVQNSNPGLGYKKDDILVISGGITNENAYLRVTGVSSTGSILSFVLENGGRYTSLPGLISNPVIGGSGTLAGFNCTAGVAAIAVSSPGNGYQVPPVVTISSPSNTEDLTAEVQAVISAGQVTSFRVVDSGRGYQSIPAVTVSNGAGATATASLSPTTLASVNVLTPGTGYTEANVVISGGGASSPAVAVASIAGNSIANIVVTDPGVGYTGVPNVTIVGNGLGATADAVLSGTSIATINMTQAGAGYNMPPNVTISGNATGASLLQSTGIGGITVTSQGENYTSDPVIYLIPGPRQTGVPLTPVLAAQRGYSIANISVVSSGVGYASLPQVVIGQPQTANSVLATANAIIGPGSGTFAIMPYYASRDYFKIWKNQVPSNAMLTRPYEDQMNTIVTYFSNLGYNINRLTNPGTNSTMMWKVQW
jgi:hypothetical protein